MDATQVMHAAEQALRQLQVSDVERNAILEAFRYKEAKMAAAVKEANARADAVVEEAAAKVVEVGATPFTRRECNSTPTQCRQERKSGPSTAGGHGRQRPR